LLTIINKSHDIITLETYEVSDTLNQTEVTKMGDFKIDGGNFSCKGCNPGFMDGIQKPETKPFPLKEPDSPQMEKMPFIEGQDVGEIQRLPAIEGEHEVELQPLSENPGRNLIEGFEG
jgi:hypothetical protein